MPIDPDQLRGALGAERHAPWASLLAHELHRILDVKDPSIDLYRVALVGLRDGLQALGTAELRGASEAEIMAMLMVLLRRFERLADQSDGPLIVSPTSN